MSGLIGKLTTLKHKDKHLIEDGWMTSDEFVDRLSLGLKEYLNSNWGHAKGELHHPEDLATTASIYMEVAYRVIADFGGCHHGKGN